MSIEHEGSGPGEEEKQALPPERNSAGIKADPSDAVMERVAYNVGETAAMLGVCEKTVRRLIARGFLRPNRALRHHLIAKKEIERFLEEESR